MIKLAPATMVEGTWYDELISSTQRWLASTMINQHNSVWSPSNLMPTSVYFSLEMSVGTEIHTVDFIEYMKKVK